MGIENFQISFNQDTFQGQIISPVEQSESKIRPKVSKENVITMKCNLKHEFGKSFGRPQKLIYNKWRGYDPSCELCQGQIQYKD